jgi:hypothetical protein
MRPAFGRIVWDTTTASVEDASPLKQKEEKKA